MFRYKPKKHFYIILINNKKNNFWKINIILGFWKKIERKCGCEKKKFISLILTFSYKIK